MSAPAAEPFRFVTVPAEARSLACACGSEDEHSADRSTLRVDERNGAAQVEMFCPDGRPSRPYHWTVTAAEFRATFEHGFEEPGEVVDEDGAWAW
jgi:hypothetical protein